MAESRLATHYDSLKVARNSPVEVIRAAYRALCQKYHPDKYPDRERAERIMKILNEAYSVLTDAERRQAHDRWIEDQEASAAAVKPQIKARKGKAVRYVFRSGPTLSEIDDQWRFRHEPERPRTARAGGRPSKLGFVRRAWLTSLLILSGAMLFVALPYQLMAGNFKWVYLGVALIWVSAGRYSYNKLFGSSRG